MSRGRGVLAVAAVAALLALAGCTSSGTPGPSSSVPSSVAGPPSGSATSPPGSGSPTATTGSSSSPGGVHPTRRASRLTHVHVADMTFVGNQAWLLGTADCLNGNGKRCAAIEHSTDGGRTWASMPSPVGVNAAIPGVGSSCAAPCVTGIRYASTTVGYLFGNQNDHGALYLTTDAGKSWRPMAGGADALEAGDGNVVRVVDSEHGDCPPGCTYRVQVAPVGSSAWHTVTLPGPAGLGDGVQLARSGAHVYLADYGHRAGGGDSARTVVWTSGNDGNTWTNRGEPCRQRGGAEYDSVQLAGGPDGSAVLLCQARIDSTGAQSVTVTTTGAHWTESSQSLGAAEVSALGAVNPSTVFVSSDQLYRSTDGGQHFAKAGQSATAPGQVSWIAFSTPTVGHAISLDRTTIWNTADGGRTWTSVVPH